MTTIDLDADALALMRLRMLAETARAMAEGVTNVALGRIVANPVMLNAGDPAPDFSLPGSDGCSYSLRELRGTPVVVAWFPKAFTSGCTAECRSLATLSTVSSRSRVQYFGASVDTPAANADFAAALGLAFPLLSDHTKAVARAYGVLGASGFASRWTFVIGADGRILHIDKHVRPSSHGSDVSGRLHELGIS